MKFETKFDLGSPVFTLDRIERHNFIDCPSCDNGEISTKTKKIKCPHCSGVGLIVCSSAYVNFASPDPLTVGQIRIEHPRDGKYSETKIQYMCKETGVGGGRLHNARDLFGSYEEAQSEALKRNGNISNGAFACLKCHDKYSKFEYGSKAGERGWVCPVHGQTRAVIKKLADKELENVN